ncbi:GerMN domain-containing protein [Chryseoglobus sp. 28M-23]|uniref:GerMN domain-containing protein n=1 Tax=Chryseoglobus sp. 28M-23 TaxID=2772253 RepID=UPI0017463204|nr:GerMN domain-containing protein [Chryseoglobus sp. 28M-23]QOD93195.1 GerMN domain-containing protein [Chryseoglobus sp. 28M-23]
MSPTRTPWRSIRGRCLALLALPALLLAGCVSVPFQSGVEAGGPIDTGVDTNFDFLPSGPSDGATQEEILSGFLTATTASQDNYRIARSYLAEDTAETWNPYAGTLVRAREGLVDRVDDTTLTYTVPVTASVDSVGRYTSSESATAQTLPPFDFVQVEGEWRIAALGDGILISQQAFPNAFSQHTLYYYDLAFRNLVPDLRWFPARAEVPTRIVRALLEPPTGWLQDATVSAVPEGTRLAATPVEVADGVARVDLTSEVLSLSDEARQLLRLQLAASLRAVSGVAGVQVTVDQNVLAIPDFTAGAPEIVPQVDARTLALTEDGFGFVTGAGEIEALGALAASVDARGATRLVLGPSRTIAALLGPEGVWLARTSSAPDLLLDARPGLIAPSVDGYQFVWSVPADGDGGIIAFELDGTPREVEAALPDDQRIVAMQVSRDDTRVLLLLDGATGPRLVVASVVRDEATGVPVRLGELRELPISGESAVDATWVDEVRVASVATTEDGTLVELHEIGGRTRSLGLPPGAAQIVGGNSGVEGIRVLGESGSIFEPRGSGWQSTGVRASFLATQQ